MNNIKVIVENAKVCGLSTYNCKNNSKLQRFGISLGWNKNHNKNRYINCLYYSDTPKIDKNRPITFEGTLVNNQFVNSQGAMQNDIQIRISIFSQPAMLEQEQVVLEEQPTDIAPQQEEDDISQWFNEEETIENE